MGIETILLASSCQCWASRGKRCGVADMLAGVRHVDDISGLHEGEGVNASVGELLSGDLLPLTAVEQLLLNQISRCCLEYQ